MLRKKAKPVMRVNNAVRKLLDDMLETMRNAPGVGLAAPQVGVSKRLVVVDVGEGPYFLVNPEIVARSSETEEAWEGCLSWPGYIGMVERNLKVSVRALDRDGHEIWVEGEGFFARALQHEIDHLDGVLFVDRATSIREAPKPEEEEFPEESPDLTGVTCVFMGSPEFAVPSLDALVKSGAQVKLVVTQPDKPVGRKQELTPTPVKTYALSQNIPVITPTNVAEPEVAARIREISPDVLAVAAYGQKIPGEILDIPKYGCLNVHPSLLPAYRGGDPIRRQIMAGETETGVTIIYMSEKLDAGDICLVRSTEIGPDETYGELSERLASIGADALVEAVSLTVAGKALRQPQDGTRATFAPHLRPGEEVIDWECHPSEVHNLVRALNPEPGAVTSLGGERIKILETRLLDKPMELPENCLPGSVVGLAGDFLLVKCGTGAIQVVSLQPAGRKAMTGKAFFVGRNRAKLRFGS